MVKKFYLLLIPILLVLIFVLYKTAFVKDSSVTSVETSAKVPEDLSVLFSEDGSKEIKSGAEIFSDFTEIKFSQDEGYVRRGVFDKDYAMVSIPYFKPTEEELESLFKVLQDNKVEDIKMYESGGNEESFGRNGSSLIVIFEGKEFDIYDSGTSFIEKSNESQYKAIVDKMKEMAKTRENNKVDFTIKIDGSAKQVFLKMDGVYVSDFWSQNFPQVLKLLAGQHRLDIEKAEKSVETLYKTYEFDIQKSKSILISVKNGELAVDSL